MRDYAMFNFEYLFGDHFAKVSLKAKLLYVNMMFFANSGFVANPKQICKNLGFPESTLDELIDNGEVITRQGRAEIVLTSYFIHNANFNPLNWTKTPYATYWRGYLWMKKNRVFTLTKPKEDKQQEEVAPKENQTPKVEKEEIDPTLPNSAKPPMSVLDKLTNIFKYRHYDSNGNEVEEEFDMEELTNKAIKATQKRNKGKELTLEEDRYIYLYNKAKGNQ